MNGESLRETLAVLASLQGLPLNYSTMGKQLHISCPAAKARLEYLDRAGFIWLLKPLAIRRGSAGKRVRKASKMYLTASAPATTGTLPPQLRFRSRMIRRICALETARNPTGSFRYYGGYGKTHVELIVQTALKRIGFVFLQDNRLSRWCWSYCKRIFRQGIIQGAFVLYPGSRIFFAADRFVVLPAEEFLLHYRRWMNGCLGSSRKLLLRMVRAYNSDHAHQLP